MEFSTATKNQITAFAISDVEYAQFVTMGTRPHVIVPRKPGGVLVFQAGGQTVFAKRVNHPGTGPNDFFDRVIRALAQYLKICVQCFLTSS
ncbi:MAG: hypothetical protein U5Q03_14915 [Bacteroidota bacterium]|nr:hypothetical protein [Bacteroidota bacterium]